MTKEVKFSAKIAKLNAHKLYIGIPKSTTEANQEVQRGAKVNVTLEVKN